ncbi:MAG: spore maturation protein [Bacillota bacterium]|jgi:spore maturation protein A|nr:spore maturation protein [Bacillota bacterium]MDK2926239.1 spore maturation protein [Bacillota bacterium]MDK2960578.1 spore maturation protein [Bacillota bacterium]
MIESVGGGEIVLDRIWLLFFLSSVGFSLLAGRPEAVTFALLKASEEAVQLAFGLIGTMAFWLGLMRIAEEAGLVRSLARALTPAFRFLFPSVPQGDPAEGAILLNIAANILGLGNAATPLGLKAIRRLQELNPYPEEATPAMCTFLAINTCCVTLVPSTIIAARTAAGSVEPAVIVIPTFLATLVATMVAVVADRIFRCRWGA